MKELTWLIARETVINFSSRENFRSDNSYEGYSNLLGANSSTTRALQCVSSSTTSVILYEMQQMALWEVAGLKLYLTYVWWGQRKCFMNRIA
jgi:hypothetical protein